MDNSYYFMQFLNKPLLNQQKKLEKTQMTKYT